ncbi:hypothetical protein LO507_002919 [Salmonella enterica subsp. arizonae serovar 41:z4,z23:-]|nr:hypothetical protein [Salmonella enterica subsp. arizonae serovar 41:z4,z23:-]
MNGQWMIVSHSNQGMSNTNLFCLQLMIYALYDYFVYKPASSYPARRASACTSGAALNTTSAASE